MPVQPIQATVAAVFAETNGGAAKANQAQRRAAVAGARPAPQAAPALTPDPVRTPSPAPLPSSPAPAVLNVTLDQNRNTIYTFTDQKTGAVVRQIPPDEVLRIMRNIESLLQQSERKLEVKS